MRTCGFDSSEVSLTKENYLIFYANNEMLCSDLNEFLLLKENYLVVFLQD